MVSFEQAHKEWIEGHLKRRSGERKGRLERGHQHGEKLFTQQIWWPIQGHFEHLHPEYEVLDWRGRPFYLDFAWLPGHVKLAIEVKGFGPHVLEMDRKRYSYELNRETYLQTLGFRVVSVCYDDVAYQPELLISLLRSLLGRYLIVSNQVEELGRIERDILKLAYSFNKPLHPVDVVNELEMNRRTAVRYLQSLCHKGRMRPLQDSHSTKVCRYQVIRHQLKDIE